MATYGRGQMLGSGINPESFKQDYSGFANAAAIRAQGLSNLGASIGGVIKEFGEVKKEQKKVDAYNKASAKAIEAAITLGGSYGITGAEETLRPFLEAYNDPNLSPIEKAALLDEGKGMIPNVFGRFDQSQAVGIQKAQLDAKNAPPIPESFGFTGSELKKTDKGNLYVLKGNDGLDYDPKTKLPIFDLDAFGEGRPPEAWSGSSTFTDSLGNLNTPSAFLPGENPSDAINYANNLTGNTQTSGLPTNINVSRPAPFLLPSQIESAANIETNPLLGSRNGDNRDLPAIVAVNQADLQPRYITDKEKVEAGKVMTQEQVVKLIEQGFKVSGTPSDDGGIFVTDIQSLAPQKGKETIFNRDGTVTIRDVSVGNKEERAENSKIDKAMALTQDLNLLEDRTQTMAPGIAGAVGRVAAEQIPGTPQAGNKEIIDRVVATLTLENLQAMRNNSPTGAALGNVSDKDAGLMRNSATSLRNAQTPEAFKRELVRLKNLQHDVIYGSKRVLEEKLKKQEITKAQFDEAMANAPIEYINERGAIEIKGDTKQQNLFQPSQLDAEVDSFLNQ
jgi:hypothetical protein